ncbi:MAG TPA: DsbA family protein [Stellaceae bacterium]|jgi:protein-disulfide isomerase|nr:DsbA family protein [Stellaceae bacterium]
MPKIWFPLVFLLFAGAIPAAAQTPNPKPASAEEQTKLLAVSPDDRVLGKADAPITIVEYASLTCPHCAHFDQEVLPKLKEKWIDSGKAKLVFRDFPLDQSALLAATVARCEPPDRFYGFVDELFRTQAEWGAAKDPRGGLQHLAQLAGMGKKDFTACIDDKTRQDKVVQSRFVAANQLAVDATPTFFINGSKFAGAPTVEDFDKALSSAAPKS